MNIPNFHDGYFDGFRISQGKVIHLFLRTVDGKLFTLSLEGVERLALSEVRQGNIIFDLVLRGADEMTCSDIEILYDLNRNTQQATDLLRRAREDGLRLLELNASYGARGLVLFRNYGIDPS